MVRSIFSRMVLVVLLSSVAGHSLAGDTPAPDGARAYFINLKDGAVVESPVFVQFGLAGMGVAPAGIQQAKETGHHHLLIDSELSKDAMNLPLPADDQHRHFGKGQTEAAISLPPGPHTLQIILGDWKHMPHSKPVMSQRINITVK